LNYLAHIHLAHATETSLLGNFLGDFVKGAQILTLDEDLQQGVRLHRKIDSFTDRHTSVVALKKQFPSSLRRMSGVILDVYFDHLLCHHWSLYCGEAMDEVLAEFYQQLTSRSVPVENRFATVRSSLLNSKWLQNYRQRSGFVGACYQIEKRLGNRIQFAAQADQYMAINHDVVEQQFMTFYPQLMQYSHSIA
jgi:acyl carrier protein phosphodiesterase